MADEENRAVLRGDRAPGEGDVVGERGRRVLDDGDGVALAGQDAVNALPAGAVDEAAVNEDDVLNASRGHVFLLVLAR